MHSNFNFKFQCGSVGSVKALMTSLLMLTSTLFLAVVVMVEILNWTWVFWFSIGRGASACRCLAGAHSVQMSHGPAPVTSIVNVSARAGCVMLTASETLGGSVPIS